MTSWKPSSCSPRATAAPMLSGFAAPVTMATRFIGALLQKKRRPQPPFSISEASAEIPERRNAQYVDVDVVERAAAHARITLPFAAQAYVLVQVELQPET